jgi:hypothetical protein
MVRERPGEPREPSVAERQDALGSQLLGERRGARPVRRVDVLVLATGVVEEPEAEYERPVDVRRRLRERESGRGHAAPVLLAVPRGFAPPRPWQHHVDECGQRPGVHSVTIAR